MKIRFCETCHIDDQFLIEISFKEKAIESIDPDICLVENCEEKRNYGYSYRKLVCENHNTSDMFFYGQHKLLHKSEYDKNELVKIDEYGWRYCVILTCEHYAKHMDNENIAVYCSKHKNLFLQSDLDTNKWVVINDDGDRYCIKPHCKRLAVENDHDDIPVYCAYHKYLLKQPKKKVSKLNLKSKHDFNAEIKRNKHGQRSCIHCDKQPLYSDPTEENCVPILCNDHYSKIPTVTLHYPSAKRKQKANKYAKKKVSEEVVEELKKKLKKKLKRKLNEEVEEEIEGEVSEEEVDDVVPEEKVEIPKEF